MRVYQIPGIRHADVQLIFQPGVQALIWLLVHQQHIILRLTLHLARNKFFQFVIQDTVLHAVPEVLIQCALNSFGTSSSKPGHDVNAKPIIHMPNKTLIPAFKGAARHMKLYSANIIFRPSRSRSTHLFLLNDAHVSFPRPA